MEVLTRLATNPIQTIRRERRQDPSLNSTCKIAKKFFQALGGLGVYGAFGCGIASICIGPGGAAFIPLIVGTSASVALCIVSKKGNDIMKESDPMLRRMVQVDLHGH